MIIVSASVSTVAEDRLFERGARLRSEGFTGEEVAEARHMQLVDHELTRTARGFEEFAELWSEHDEQRWFRRVYLGDAPQPADSDYRRWYRTVLDFDPLPLLERQSLPVLWLFGDPSLDRLGPVEESIRRLEALRNAGKPYTIHAIPDANHSLVVDDEPARATFARVRSLVEPWLHSEVQSR